MRAVISLYSLNISIKKGYEPGTSLNGTVTKVPRRFGDTGGLGCGVVGAVKVPPRPTIDKSTREPAREGGADPKNTK